MIMNDLEQLPMEIVNKIMIYMTNPLADLFKKSKFFGKPFPFLYCPNASHEKSCSSPVRSDYDNIIGMILKNRRLQNNVTKWKYPMFFIHSNDHTVDYYMGTDILYIVGLPRFRNELGLDEVRVNLFPTFQQVASEIEN